MTHPIERRRFVADTGQAVVAAMSAGVLARRDLTTAQQRSRVVVIRHRALTAEPTALAQHAVRLLLDEAACVLSGESDPASAWTTWFDVRERVAVKVNCLGLPTHPAVAHALAQALNGAGVPPERTLLWDRSDRELERAGYQLNRSGSGVRCYGTDSLDRRGWGGYESQVTTSGAIGSLFSRIITEECDALVSAAVLKDHNLAGLSCTLKNFYGAIHNPNKYHDDGCDPFVADVCAHNLIRGRLRLAVCDATRPQFHGGPPSRTRWQWPYGGIILSTDPVAVDRVALEILERKRSAEQMIPLAADDRPVRYLASAAARGLGSAELGEIEVVSIGKPWLDVT